MSLKKIKIGDVVNIECLTSFFNMARINNSTSKVTKITTKYDENTGKSYKVLWCDKRGFKISNGEAITPPFHYYVVGKVK